MINKILDSTNKLLLSEVYSDTTTKAASTSLNNPLNISNIGEIVGLALNIVTGIGWSIAFVYFAMGFIKYITSKGEKTATQDAQQMITYAVIGAVGLLLLGAMRNIITGILGPVLPEGYVPQTDS